MAAGRRVHREVHDNARMIKNVCEPPQRINPLRGLIRGSFRSTDGVMLPASLVVSLAYNGIHFWALALSLALLLAAAARPLAGSGAFPAVRLSPLSVALGLWWVWLVAGVLWSPVPYATTIDVWSKGAVPLAFLALRLHARPARAWRWSAAGLLAIGAALALWGVREGAILDLKPRSAFLNPNSHAAFLNMTALVGAGLWLRRRAAHTDGRAGETVLAGLFLLAAFAMALVGSRGALLAFAGGVALVTVTAYRRGRSRDATVLFGLSALAVALAHLVRGDMVGDRLASLANPAAAGSGRFLIWEATLRMVRDAPWWGAGPGTFWLRYPQYRHPEDGSGGYFAHNDYLQLLLEDGWPGLVLTLALLTAAAWTVARVVTRHHALPSRLEAAGLGAALAAVAIHSLVTFNFYVLPILVACGMILGRLDQLAAEAGIPSLTVRWARGRPLVRPVVRGLAVWGLWLLAILHPTTLALAQHHSEEARRLATIGHAADAERLLQQAARLAPSTDGPRLYLAELYIRALERADKLELAARERLTLARAAAGALDEAQRLNPLRPDAPYLRGRLLQTAVGLTPADAEARAEAEYRAALRLDPMYVKARVALVNLLVRAGRRKEAAAAVCAGLGRWYPPEPRYIAFLRFAATALDDLGDPEGAARARAAAERLAQQRETLVRELQRRGRLPVPGDP